MFQFAVLGLWTCFENIFFEKRKVCMAKLTGKWKKNPVQRKYYLFMMFFLILEY